MSGTTLDIGFPAGPVRDLWTGRNSAPRVLQDVADTDLDVVGRVHLGRREFGSGSGCAVLARRTELGPGGDRPLVSGKVRVDVYRMEDGTPNASPEDAQRGAPAVLPRRSVRRRVDVRAIVERHALVPRRIVHDPASNSARWVSTGPPSRHRPPRPSRRASTTSRVRHRRSCPTPDRRSATSSSTRRPATPRSRGRPISPPRACSVTDRRSISSETAVGAVDTTNAFDLDRLPDLRPAVLRAPSVDQRVGTTIGQIVEFVTEPCVPIVSDDFSSGQLEAALERRRPGRRRRSSPSTDTSTLVSLAAGSDHDLFPGANRATRLRQAGPLGNFGVEAKFESVLTSRFQTAGSRRRGERRLLPALRDPSRRFAVCKAYVASVVDGVVIGSALRQPAGVGRALRAGAALG